MIDSKNTSEDIVSRYFDIVQEEIKKLISEDKEIKQSQVEMFNNEIFNQPDEISGQIRQYIDKATNNNLDIKKVAKVIYDKFKLQVKNNVFNKDDVNDVPNPMVGERKHIKTFEQYNESSFFHSQTDIDRILDEITRVGYEELSLSDKAILMNFAKDDEDIHSIIMAMNNCSKEFIKLNNKIEALSITDVDLAKKKYMGRWIELNKKLSGLESDLINLYKIEDSNDVWNYQSKNNIKADDY